MQLNKHDIVFYTESNNSDNTYEIISVEKGTKLTNSPYIFGYDNEGNLMNNYDGRFDFILAEYDKNKTFIKNIACTRNELSKG